ncbi:phosphatidylserine decarboxylase proenzyme 2-like [Arachis stenosperma]|uniref:phosphatidylserine decarboxylase proenzyme 2-like n=1 Tax=Arachis stenosperma TaxID=217475 RepID=UPI0025ABD7DF|nr:phosphatidylserine decarboxylase proenzyme 2-like [Arachis stenosperma]
MCSNAFVNGTLVIFPLEPQDYHHFHVLVSGTIEQFVDIPGCLYTVNPIAVNSKYCIVFTENKQVVSIISTVDFRKVVFVVIGATMVGSITFTRKMGDYVKKGDELQVFLQKGKRVGEGRRSMGPRFLSSYFYICTGVFNFEYFGISAEA